MEELDLTSFAHSTRPAAFKWPHFQNILPACLPLPQSSHCEWRLFNAAPVALSLHQSTAAFTVTSALWRFQWAPVGKLPIEKLASVENTFEIKASPLCARRKSLRHLPDALCQQVRALIDLRLLNCAPDERGSLFRSFLPFHPYYLFAFGMDTAGLNVKVWNAGVEFIFLQMHLFYSARGQI